MSEQQAEAPGTGSLAGLPPRLAKALSKLNEISTLPEVTTKIVQVVEDPRASAHDMHEIIRTDLALATKILKVVNSAFYGLPSQISSLDRAIVLLGLSAVKNIALAASLSRMFNTELLSDQFTARDLWRHSIAVAVAARLLAGQGRVAPADESFVAGLVHDMGLIVMQQLFPREVAEVVDKCRDESQRFWEVEISVIGADHQAIGSVLAQRWQFPERLRDVIACHHNPNALPVEQRKAPTLIYVAETLCARNHHGFCLTAGNQEIPAQMLELLGVDEQVLSRIPEELPEKIQEVERVFAD